MHFLVALLVVFSWGFNSVVSKIGVTHLPVFLFLSLRFLGTGLLFLPFSKIKKEDLKKYFSIGISFNVLHIGFICLSLYHLTASSSATIQQIQTPIAIILAALFLKEKVTITQFIGVFFAIAGIVVIYGLPEVNFIGFCFTIISAIFFAITQLLLRKSGKMHLPSFVSMSSLFAVPFLLVFSYFFDRKIDFYEVSYLPVCLSLLYQIIILGFSTAIWQRLIAAYGVNRINPINLLSVVFAIGSGVVILNETISTRIVVGALVIIIGVALTMFFKEEKNN